MHKRTTTFAVDVTGSRVKIVGDVDLATAPQMIDAVSQAMTVELDLSEVSFIDMAGLHGLIQLRNSRSGLHIVALSPEVRRVLERTRLSESFVPFLGHYSGEISAG